MAARLGLAAVVAAVALDSVALALDITLGRRIMRGEEVAAASLETSSSLSSAANVAIPVAVVLGGLLFVWWFHCAYRSRAENGLTALAPIWAAVGWVLPGLNLIRPPRIMQELTGRAGLVGAWWAMWLIGGLIQVVLRFISPATEQGWINWLSTALGANLVLLVSLGLAFVLVGSAETARRWAPGPAVDPQPGVDRGV